MRLKQSCKQVEKSSNNDGLVVEENNVEQSNENLKDDDPINDNDNIFYMSNIDVSIDNYFIPLKISMILEIKVFLIIKPLIF